MHEKSHKELFVADLQATIPPSNADEKSHKELYVADLQATTPTSNANEKRHKELYVADLLATTPTPNADEKSHKMSQRALCCRPTVLQATTLNQMQMKRVTKSSMLPIYRPQPPHQIQMKKSRKELYVADLQSYRPQPLH